MSLRISSNSLQNRDIVSFDILKLHTEHEAYISKMYDDSSRRIIDPNDCKNLYAFQGEMAIVQPSRDNDKVQTIVTDDTTTCITMVIRHVRSGITCQIHCDTLNFDGDSILEFRQLFMNIIELSRNAPTLDQTESERTFNLSLFGGYLDEKGISEKLFVTMMLLLNSVCNEIVINLCCAITGSWNTVQKTVSKPYCGQKTVQAPKVYGVATDVQTGKMFDAVLDHSRIDSIPLATLRRALIIWERTSCFWSIYNTVKNRIELEPRQITNLPYLGRYIHSHAQMSDEEILQRCSTSPFVEPAHFVSEYRSLMSFLAKNIGPRLYEMFFPNKKPRIFVVKDSKWTELK